MVSKVKRVVALPIKGYEGLYEVTSEGDVYSLNYNKTGKRVKLKVEANKSGYLMVSLHKDGKRKNLYVHHLVADAFIHNPECRQEVDHINTIKSDNRVENLRWCTRLENMNNPITEVVHRDANIKANAKMVYCIELDKVFESSHEAARQLGLWSCAISACCRGERKTHGGCHFRFA